ncbi:MAG TPA: type II toxin-antitoxin system VapC family toxin [Solirubrobacterales bacterium]|jgi:PIN domain nuclease of toxin-antitoxin system|nr:type II toxin-antitoxin system VapC family toxin [Solirubrobacterales bacterium]
MLLDTHALLWYVLGERERISRPLQARIERGPSIASVASLWEIAIKSALGKLDAPDDLPARVEEIGFELLPVAAEHVWAVREMPHHHRDPFDRLLIAQARVERLPIVTADPAFAAYGVEVVWE